MKRLVLLLGLLVGGATFAAGAHAQTTPTLEEARALYDAGDLNAARDALTAMVAGGSRDPDVYLLLGVVERSRGSYGSAIRSLQMARSIDPAASAVSLELATTLAWNEELVMAEELYRQILQTEPNSTDARMGLAFALAWQGKLAEAEELFRAITVQDPQNPSAWTGIGFVERARFNRDAATAAYSRVLELDPGNAEAIAAIEGLRWDRRTELRGSAGVTRLADGADGTEGRVGVIHSASSNLTLIGGVQRYVFGAADPLSGIGAGTGEEEWGVEGGAVYRPSSRTAIALTVNTFIGENANRGIFSIEGVRAVSPRVSLLAGLRPVVSSVDPKATLSGTIGGTVALHPAHHLTARALIAGNTTFEPRVTALLNYGASPTSRLLLQASLAHAEDDRFGFTSYSAGLTLLLSPGFGISIDGNHRSGFAERSTLLGGLVVRF